VSSALVQRTRAAYTASLFSVHLMAFVYGVIPHFLSMVYMQRTYGRI
jgi:hypothetical protein